MTFEVKLVKRFLLVSRKGAVLIYKSTNEPRHCVTYMLPRASIYLYWLSDGGVWRYSIFRLTLSNFGITCSACVKQFSIYLVAKEHSSVWAPHTHEYHDLLGYPFNTRYQGLYIMTVYPAVTNNSTFHFSTGKRLSMYSGLSLLRCLIIRNATYYDTRSISQLLQTIRNLYWIIR